MNRKVLSVVLMLTLLAGGVGLGIHLLHRDGLALTNFIVFMIDQEEDEGVPGLWVEMRFQIDEVWSEWCQTEDRGGGKYVKSYFDGVEAWQIRFTSAEWQPWDPEENPCEPGVENNGFEWLIQQI